MKKLSTLLGLILIIIVNYSCSPRNLAQRQVSVFYSDYSKYAKEGFMITPDMYTGKYEACGEISIDVFPGELLKEEVDKRDEKEAIYSPSTNKYIVKENISNDELIKMAVDKAKEVGANALVNFKCLEIYSTYYDTRLREVVKLFSNYEISGFAIKRQ